MYIIRDAAGKISGLSISPTESSEQANPLDPELKEFLSLTGTGFSATDQLDQSDIASVRILEDLINVLIDRGSILFTDLPEQAQTRLLQRKLLRKMMRQEKGIADDDEFILSDDKIF